MSTRIFSAAPLSGARILLFSLIMTMLPAASLAASMTWVIYDSCPGREPIRFRFFDITNNLVWPGPNRFYYTKKYGEGYTQQLNCERGAKICYGAWQTDAQGYWGAGEDGAESCQDCCAICDGDRYVKKLTCR